jgi:two-component sensor histidine kinase
MRTMLSAVSANTKYKIDFKLIPVAVVLIQISIFATQFSEVSNVELQNLILLRLSHTALILVMAYLVSKAYLKLGTLEFNYQTLAFYGILFLVIGDITHAYFANLFGIELIGGFRRVGILIVQGFFWFPAFMIISGYREDILSSFHDYEQQLLINTRARSRASREFKASQVEIQNQTRFELLETCRKLRESISEVLASKKSLAQKNAEIRPYLLGDGLRKLSMRLDTVEQKPTGRTLFGKDIKSIRILIHQFRILSSSSVKNAALGWRAYAIVFVLLITPPYINFYSFYEALISYPVLIFLAVFCSHLIAKTQASNSVNRLRASSLLILLTGLLPFFLDLAEQALTSGREKHFPPHITALALPLTYYIFMEAIQVLRPKALDIVRSGELKASQALQSEVTRVVRSEFVHNLSHQWAVFIHGKIITRLAATSLKLESAAEADDEKAFDETIQSLLVLLSSPDSDFDEISMDLETELTSRLDPWVGLLKINLYIAPDLKSVRNSRVREMGEVVEELISNSIRHGKAKQIDLQVRSSGESDVEITATDDSIFAPSQLEERPGLGTRIFNLASDGRWSISRDGSSTKFTLTMGIRA